MLLTYLLGNLGRRPMTDTDFWVALVLGLAALNWLMSYLDVGDYPGDDDL